MLRSIKVDHVQVGIALQVYDERLTIDLFARLIQNFEGIEGLLYSLGIAN